jgi:hypothetical protein
MTRNTHKQHAHPKLHSSDLRASTSRVFISDGGLGSATMLRHPRTGRTRRFRGGRWVDAWGPRDRDSPPSESGLALDPLWT